MPLLECFCGAVSYAQSYSVFCSRIGKRGTVISKLPSSDPPASSTSTDTEGSSDSRLATTAPAEPDPTIMWHQIISYILYLVYGNGGVLRQSAGHHRSRRTGSHYNVTSDNLVYIIFGTGDIGNKKLSASSTSTDREGSSDRRLATTAPAEPDPTIVRYIVYDWL